MNQVRNNSYAISLVWINVGPTAGFHLMRQRSAVVQRDSHNQRWCRIEDSDCRDLRDAMASGVVICCSNIQAKHAQGERLQHENDSDTRSELRKRSRSLVLQHQRSHKKIHTGLNSAVHADRHAHPTVSIEGQPPRLQVLVKLQVITDLTLLEIRKILQHLLIALSPIVGFHPNRAEPSKRAAFFKLLHLGARLGQLLSRGDWQPHKPSEDLHPERV
mmetsp:Transcript_13682/g.30660  ORF Transcript_13682/g.30660 Transcript_13682/m.30660 type:complete len:217 (-) Transcript_13682:343-993(-)